jgi:glutamine kinase
MQGFPKHYTKAESLHLLKKNEKKLSIRVPKLIYFTKKAYLDNPDKIFNRIKTIFKKKIIIRSSSLLEDNPNKSLAGKFKSFDNLLVKKEAIHKCVKEVIKDFKNKDDQIIIQEFISKADLSGVIFTRNINNNSPYYVINFDKSGFTNLVTSGSSNPLMQTITIKRNNKDNYKFFSRELKSIKKIETLFKNDRLDIEFCRKKNVLYIFQCRPLKNLPKINDKEFDQVLINIEKKIKKIKNQIPNLFGKTTYFANMTDWNPAEMIGIRPSPLSISLYSELITDEIWAKQRKIYMYQDVRPNPLMINFVGSPYIDLRVDFNSFLPADLPSKVKEKAVNFYLKKIKSNPNLQDKIEFELIETCYDFNTKKNLLNFLSQEEASIYTKSLKNLTNKIFNNKLLESEINKIKILEKKIETLKKSRLPEIQKIFFYINDCKQFGTLPFAGAARNAFIATKILRSLVKINILEEKDIENFYQSIPTVTKKMQSLYRETNNINKKKIFLEMYGHLRPSTYSISSKNYKENFNEYFSKKMKGEKFSYKKMHLTKNKERMVNLIFKKHGLKTTCIKFLSFASRSISFREHAKLIFSKSINEIFINLIKLSKEIKISRNDLEYVSIKNFIVYYNNVEPQKLKSLLIKEIKKNKRDIEYLNLIEFPELITNETDLYCHEQKSRKGNYITNKTISGEIVSISEIKNYSTLSNKIVLIENADPGYDFIFSYKIKGLITEYGGANSHMSIRCLELGIPAIIGIGSKDYKLISTKNFILINSKQKNFKIIN